MKNNRVSSYTYKKSAFTLAEVLITLGIIGIVAAMTMPALMNNIENRQFVSKLQKVYSVLSQATISAQNENGLIEYWNFKDGSTEDVERIYEYYHPYLNVMEDCGTDSGAHKGKGCMSADTKTFDGTEPRWQLSVHGHGGNVKSFRLADGTGISIDGDSSSKDWFGVKDHTFNENYPVFMVDLNGLKKPNVIGRDIFFFLLSNNGIVPAGIDSTNDCKKNNKGYSCAGKVLYEKKISY